MFNAIQTRMLSCEDLLVIHKLSFFVKEYFHVIESLALLLLGRRSHVWESNGHPVGFKVLVGYKDKCFSSIEFVSDFRGSLI